MAFLWPRSFVPFPDPNGDPYSGAKAYFFNAETTTAQTIYQDPDFTVPHTNPVIANGNGMFPAVYIKSSPGLYRERVTDADDAVLFDADGISVPQAVSDETPGAGDTDSTLLFRTGMLQHWYCAGSRTGWVRCNGRTIGSESSGATERASDDCHDLFVWLWAQDSTLTVSGGRGGTGEADWASDKTIEVPDLRNRALAGLASMGASTLARIDNSLIRDSKTNTTLGANAGLDTVVLDVTEMPSHLHTATFAGNALPTHKHTTSLQFANGYDGTIHPNFANSDSPNPNAVESADTSLVSAGTPTGSVTVASAGGGEAHNNVQPTMLVSIYVKL